MKNKKTQNKQTLNISIPVMALVDYQAIIFKGLPPNKIYKLIISYPVSVDANFSLRTGKGGMTFFRLLQEIGKAYDHVYDHANKYGVWGHNMSDLQLEEIIINHKKREISIGVSS